VLTLLLGLTALLAVFAAIFFFHIRWYWHAAICGGLYGLYIFLQMKVSKLLMRSVSEEEYIDFFDKLLGMDKEPSKDWYFFP
jgi:hypothetical protein